MHRCPPPRRPTPPSSTMADLEAKLDMDLDEIHKMTTKAAKASGPKRGAKG